MMLVLFRTPKNETQNIEKKISFSQQGQGQGSRYGINKREMGGSVEREEGAVWIYGGDTVLRRARGTERKR